MMTPRSGAEGTTGKLLFLIRNDGGQKEAAYFSSDERTKLST